MTDDTVKKLESKWGAIPEDITHILSTRPSIKAKYDAADKLRSDIKDLVTTAMKENRLQPQDALFALVYNSATFAFVATIADRGKARDLLADLDDTMIGLVDDGMQQNPALLESTKKLGKEFDEMRKADAIEAMMGLIEAKTARGA